MRAPETHGVAMERCLVDTEQGTVTGLAAVWDEPNENGALFERDSLNDWLADGQPVAFLWQHDPDEPIGVLGDVRPTDAGLEFAGTLNLDTQRGREARSLLQQGAITGVSVGVNPIDVELHDGIRHVSRGELWEISLVTFPAERRARVTEVANRTTASNRERLLRARHAARRRRNA